MSVAVRPVNLDSEQTELLNILETNLSDLPHARRFQWLYRNNPAGPAWSWFVYEKGTGEIVGVASLFPRILWVGETTQRCGQVGDFAINVSHRSLGPALSLQRATFEPVIQGDLAFCYDCPPHDRGLSTFRRLGIKASGRMHRYALLVRTDRQVRRWLGRGRTSAAIATLGNWLFALRPFAVPSRGDLDIAIHVGRFNEEFTELDQRCKDKCIRSRRTASDLNWRYRDDPLQQYQVLTARQKGELVGCAVYLVIEQDARLVDLWGTPLSSVGPPLLGAMTDLARQGSAQTLHALVADRPEDAELLQQAGFRRREDAAHIVAYTQPNSALDALLGNPEQWSFNYANITV
jgi:hypothetical protein